MIKSLNQFPLMARYKEVFPNINEHSIIAYDGNIYTNDNLPDHLIMHEEEHLRQQEEIGLKKWVNQYLADPEFRLNMEVHAYQVQIESIKDRNKRDLVRRASAKLLSSDLYNNIISYESALELL